MAGGVLILNDGPTNLPAQVRATAPTVIASGSPQAALGEGEMMMWRRDDPSTFQVMRLGGTQATAAASGGSPDWQEIGLPFKRPLLVWRGMSLLQMTIPVLLSAQTADIGTLRASEDVYRALQFIKGCWRTTANGEHGAASELQPPVLKLLSGGYLPFEGESGNWILKDVVWGAGVADRETHMRPWQQELTLTFCEYRADERLSTVSKSGGNHDPHKKLKQKTYVVRHGETLKTIAKKLKIDGGWQALGQAQKPKITDARKVKVGKHLTLRGLYHT